MTNQEKIERIREIYADFIDSLNFLKKEANRRSETKLKAHDKIEIDELLEKISKHY